MIRLVKWNAIVISLFGVALTGCDLKATNPGPVDDSALDSSAAHEALVNGMARALSKALTYIAYTGAATTREVVATGATNPGTLGITVKQSVGLLDPALDESDDHWRYAQQARWVAEDGVRRIRLAQGAAFASSALAARALVYVGLANRLLGENMCDAVFDGGAVEPRRTYLTRAEAAFTEAIAIAAIANDKALGNAAIAGRASVRAGLGSWSGVVSDALQVPSSFVFQAIYSSTDVDQYNRINASNATATRAHSVVGTFFESYYKQTSDKRTAWTTNAAFPKGTGNVLWYLQTKYDNRGAPVNLVSGREMRLLIAEASLRNGDWTTALSMINTLRAESGVVLWTATGVDQTWTMLGRERAIEFWLEGRRLGDLFRWQADKVPGTFDDMTGRDRCFPIGVTERAANPNF